MFINVSNHPSAKWSAEQLSAAKALGGGEVRDIQFPNVPPAASMTDVAELATNLAAQIGDTDVAMVQGEASLCYSLTMRLRKRGLRVVVACTERKVQEVTKIDGSVEKTAVFAFVGFRNNE
jgi:hypothetical protein